MNFNFSGDYIRHTLCTAIACFTVLNNLSLADRFGCALAVIQDVNEDGVREIVVGDASPRADGTGYAAYVLDGKSGERLFSCGSGHLCSESPEAILGGFDLNSDGHGDFAVAAREGPGSNLRVFVYSGLDFAALGSWGLGEKISSPERVRILAVSSKESSAMAGLVVLRKMGSQSTLLHCGFRTLSKSKIAPSTLLLVMPEERIQAISQEASGLRMLRRHERIWALKYIEGEDRVLPLEEATARAYRIALGKLNDDPTTDVVYVEALDGAKTGFSLRALDGKGGKQLYSVTLPWEKDSELGLHVISDLNGDGCSEIVISSWVPLDIDRSFAQIRSGRNGKTLRTVAFAALEPNEWIRSNHAICGQGTLLSKGDTKLYSTTYSRESARWEGLVSCYDIDSAAHVFSVRRRDLLEEE